MALAYKLVEIKKPRSGNIQQKIEHDITSYKKIMCGNKLWELSDEEISQYHKFSLLEKLLVLNFDEAKIQAEKIDAEEAKENKKIV